jgi:hypothetical protein
MRFMLSEKLTGISPRQNKVTHRAGRLETHFQLTRVWRIHRPRDILCDRRRDGNRSLGPGKRSSGSSDRNQKSIFTHD